MDIVNAVTSLMGPLCDRDTSLGPFNFIGKLKRPSSTKMYLAYVQTVARGIDLETVEQNLRDTFGR